MRGRAFSGRAVLQPHAGHDIGGGGGRGRGCRGYGRGGGRGFRGGGRGDGRGGGRGGIRGGGDYTLSARSNMRVVGASKLPLDGPLVILEVCPFEADDLRQRC